MFVFLCWPTSWVSVIPHAGMAGCDAVVHAAAKVEGSGAWQPFLEVTVRGGGRCSAFERMTSLVEGLAISDLELYRGS